MENEKKDEEKKEETKTLSGNELRVALYNSFLLEYRKLVDLVRSLPFPPEAFLQSLMFFDTGVLWTKEAIYMVPFVQKAAPESEAEKPLENKEVETEAAKEVA